MCLSLASRPTRASFWARWIASSSHSWMVTKVRSAPSATRSSTLAAHSAEPRWVSTTVARENRPTSTMRWPFTRARSRAVRVMLTGSVSSTSPGMVTTVAFSAAAHAAAEARSAGRRTTPNALSPTLASLISTPAGAAMSTLSLDSSVGSTWNRAPTRSTGVNRQSSSRPFGIAKSSTS